MAASGAQIVLVITRRKGEVGVHFAEIVQPGVEMRLHTLGGPPPWPIVLGAISGACQDLIRMGDEVVAWVRDGSQVTCTALDTKQVGEAGVMLCHATEVRELPPEDTDRAITRVITG